jgi:prepilin-type N-terminal cleavage/methylation domain-containing protein
VVQASRLPRAGRRDACTAESACPFPSMASYTLRGQSPDACVSPPPPGRKPGFRTGNTGGFTLVETLVTLTIIALLTGMLLTGVFAVREGGRRRQATTEASALLKALHDYRALYGKWPLQTQDAADRVATNNADVVAALDVDSSENPRQRAFITSRALLPRKDDAGAALPLPDPWGKPYILAFDDDGDGDIVVSNPLVVTISNVAAAVLARGGKEDGFEIAVPTPVSK